MRAAKLHRFARDINTASQHELLLLGVYCHIQCKEYLASIVLALDIVTADKAVGRSGTNSTAIMAGWLK